VLARSSVEVIDTSEEVGPRVEQRIIIKFLAKEKIKLSEICIRIKTLWYGGGFNCNYISIFLYMLLVRERFLINAS